jgi:hypothetical protein
VSGSGALVRCILRRFDGPYHKNTRAIAMFRPIAQRWAAMTQLSVDHFPLFWSVSQ